MPTYNRKPSNRRKPQTRRASPVKKGTPAWVWFGSGLVMGIFLMLIKDVGKPDGPPTAETASSGSKGAETRHRPRFDFYDLLPESRVPVGADRPAPVAPPYEPTPQATPAPQPGPAQQEQPAVVETPAPPSTPSRPEQEPKATASAEGTTSTDSSERYLLQAGSFRSHGDADNLRAQLLLMGMSASIETFNPRQGETWHRVIVGPYSDRRSMDSAQSQLTANGIDTLMLRR